MAWGLLDAPRRHDRPIELEAADVHASKRPLALQRHQPDPEAGRGAGVAQLPKDNGMGACVIIPTRPRTVRAVVELAPFLTIEGFERPISPTAAAALSKGFLDELRAGMDEQEGNDLEIDAVLWVDGAKPLNDPEAFANSCLRRSSRRGRRWPPSRTTLTRHGSARAMRRSPWKPVMRLLPRFRQRTTA